VEIGILDTLHSEWKWFESPGIPGFFTTDLESNVLSIRNATKNTYTHVYTRTHTHTHTHTYKCTHKCRSYVITQHLVCCCYKYWTHSLTYLLTPWSRVLLEKLTGSASSQEILRIFGTRMFITVLTSDRHLSLSWANSIQSPQLPPTSWRSVLILSSHLRLGLPNDLFPSGFPTRTLCTPLPCTIRATCPAHLILLDFTTRTIFGKIKLLPQFETWLFLLHASKVEMNINYKLGGYKNERVYLNIIY